MQHKIWKVSMNSNRQRAELKRYIKKFMFIYFYATHFFMFYESTKKLLNTRKKNYINLD